MGYFTATSLLCPNVSRVKVLIILLEETQGTQLTFAKSSRSTTLSTTLLCGTKLKLTLRNIFPLTVVSGVRGGFVLQEKKTSAGSNMIEIFS